MSLKAGTRLGPYEVVAPIGAGGMGEVYQARDTRLGRTVAIKVLSERLGADADVSAGARSPGARPRDDRRQRFEREARAISALNHPHICTLHDIGQHDGATYLVMEHLEGETLAERLRRAALPIRQTLDIAAQIADALDAAHKHGIVHRDLKPGNVMLTPSGIKLLDFGLAKLAEDRAPDAASTEPTAEGPLTDHGSTVGTVAYMSPEQATGEDVDARSDLFSLGIVLYEMATRHQPFTGATVASVFDAILHKSAVPPVRFNPEVPADLERIIAKALEKDREVRYQSAADLRGDLKRLMRDSDSGHGAASAVRTLPGPSSAVTPPARRPWVRWAIGAGAVVAIGSTLALAVLARRPSPPAPVPAIANPAQLTSAQGIEDNPSWSPDGRAIAYQSDQSGNWDIWVTQVGSKAAVNRTADSPVSDRLPSWSPDGLWIAFFSVREGRGYFLMPAVGGSVRKIASWPKGDRYPMPVTWSPDSSQVAYPLGQVTQPWLEILTLATRASRKIPLPKGPRNNVVLDLSWSPDGRWLAYGRSLSTVSPTAELWLTRVADGESLRLTDGTKWDRSPVWSSDSRGLSFVSDRGGSSDLWAFTPGPKGFPEGTLQRVTAGLEMDRAAASRDGARLAFTKGRGVSNVFRAPLLPDRAATWEDVTQLTSDEATCESIDVSRDGRLVVSSDRSGNWDIWTLSANGGELEQLTADPAIDSTPRWKPDGSEIVFHSSRTGHREVWIQPIAGAPPRQVSDGPEESYYATWSFDGTEVVFLRKDRLFIAPAQGGSERPLADTGNATTGQADWSPDGKWVLFSSNRDGTFKAYRIRASGGPAERLSERPAVGGPRWSRDGRSVYFVGRGETTDDIWALSVGSRQERPLTALSGRRGSFWGDLATDGRSVYFLWEESRSDIWVADLAQRSR